MQDELKPRRYGKDAARGLEEMERLSVLMAEGGLWLAQCCEVFRNRVDGIELPLPKYPHGDLNFSQFGHQCDVAVYRFRKSVDKLDAALKGKE